MGVALVDAQTRDLSNEATAVFAEIGENAHVHKELLRNTVEIVTGVCDSTAQAMDDLQSTLKSVLPIVRQRGMESSARALIRSRVGQLRS